MSNYKVDITGINTKDIKVLKNKEMKELFIKYQNGDLLAKEELVNGNLKLVLSILKKFNNTKHNMDDLFQIGCIGLIKAVDNFDLSHNVMFSTYAVPLILGEVKRYIRDNTTMRIARSIKDLSYKILRYKEEYYNEFGAEPTTKDIANYFEINEYQIALALDSLREPASIFEPIYNDGGDTIYILDQVADKQSDILESDLNMMINKALDKLKERERKILIDRFIVGKTQTEIATLLGISQAQVSRIEKSGLNNARKLIK